MLSKTSGITLNSVRYGDNGLVVKIFTKLLGVQSYLVQGIRGGKLKSDKSASFQPGTILELVVYNQPEKNLQRISEFRREFIYSSIQQDVIKNCILLFTVDLLSLLLAEQGPMPDFYDFSMVFFLQLDGLPDNQLANLPLYFTAACGRFFGIDPVEALHQDIYPQVGEVIFNPARFPASLSFSDQEKHALKAIYRVKDWLELATVSLNREMRFQLIEKLTAFYFGEMHTNNNLKTLPVLKAILQ